MPVTNKEVEKRKDIRDNLDFFKELVEWNKKDGFFVQWENKEYQDWMLKWDYNFFIKKLKMFEDSISNDYPDFWDFQFIKTYLTKIFTAIYTKNTLLSVFENNEIKDKFFSCMQKYFYWNFWKMSVELVKKYPREIKSWDEIILNKEEIQWLLNWDWKWDVNNYINQDWIDSLWNK
jgi:hypothetical protein